MVTVEQLYKSFGVLADAKERAGEHETDYLQILKGVKGGPAEKRLASQFIPRFFKHFPGLAEKAIDAQLDLCEDEDVQIRKQAVKDLPQLCKDSKEHLPRIADILTQLLQTEDDGELSLVQSSLLNLCRADMKGALGGIFEQINADEDIIRERAIKFLAFKLQSSLPDDLFTKEVEDLIFDECKKVLQDVTGDEFVAFMKLLSGLKSMGTVQGRQHLVEIVADQADLDKPFEVSEPESSDRLIQCVRQALPYFSKNVQSTKFVVYMCDHVLPVLSSVQAPDELATEENGTERSDNKQATQELQLELLKLLAELSTHCGDVENIEERLEKIYNKLLEYMPPPPAEDEGENKTPDEDSNLQFSHVECLMYAFHRLGSKCPEFLTADEHVNRLKDFRVRLQYFARGVQVYIKQLRVALQGKTGDALKTEENKIKAVALKITSNINTLIKDLFHTPPHYKAVISLSWKPVKSAAATTGTSPGQKRQGITPITFESDGSKPKTPKTAKTLYKVPEGKWSEKAGNFPIGNRGRGRGNFRGGFRGRGQWRGRGSYGNYGGYRY